jgi:hypothetical protein
VLVNEVRGEPEELLDRFVKLVGSPGREDEYRWLSMSHLVFVAIRIPPTWDDLIPESADQVSILRRIRHRILDLFDQIDEFFLIIGLLAYLDEWMERRADIARVDMRAEALRRVIDAIKKDPEQLAAVRHELEKQDQSIAGMSHEEFLHYYHGRLQENAPAERTTAESATQRWSELEEWRRDKTNLFSDEFLEVWSIKRIFRHRRA